MPTPLIRNAEVDDLDALYDVCLRTGDGGEDASKHYDNPRLLGEVYVGPYVALDSGLGFTAVDGGHPSGYILGTADTRRFEAACEVSWWPELRKRYPKPKRDPSTPGDELIAVIHDPRVVADEIVAQFPAHLHIDLLPTLRGQGVGRVMMDRLLSALVADGARGVHADVDLRNDRAIGFYRYLGFSSIGTIDDVVVMGIRLSGI